MRAVVALAATAQVAPAATAIRAADPDWHASRFASDHSSARSAPRHQVRDMLTHRLIR